MLVAAAAMALAGCSKEDVSDNALPGSGTKATRGFTAEIASSRTTLNDAATRMKWTAGDKKAGGDIADKQVPENKRMKEKYRLSLAC